MRKNVWILLMAVCMLGFAACSDDDDDKKGTISEEAAGTYVGDLTVTMGETAVPMENQKITMVSTGENMLTMKLENFKFGEMEVGTLTVPNVRISEGGSVSGNAKEVGILGGLIKADLSLTGTLKDNKADLKIMVEAPLVAGGDPITMAVTFKGSK